MINQVDITPIVQAIIALCAAMITAFAVPWIKSKISAQDRDDLMAWVRIAVAAAEQIYDANDGNGKKVYVMEFLENKGYKIDYESLDNAVEAAVIELHNRLYGEDVYQ